MGPDKGSLKRNDAFARWPHLCRKIPTCSELDVFEFFWQSTSFFNRAIIDAVFELADLDVEGHNLSLCTFPRTAIQAGQEAAIGEGVNGAFEG